MVLWRPEALLRRAPIPLVNGYKPHSAKNWKYESCLDRNQIKGLELAELSVQLKGGVVLFLIYIYIYMFMLFGENPTTTHESQTTNGNSESEFYNGLQKEGCCFSCRWTQGGRGQLSPAAYVMIVMIILMTIVMIIIMRIVMIIIIIIITMILIIRRRRRIGPLPGNVSRGTSRHPGSAESAPGVEGGRGSIYTTRVDTYTCTRMER